MLDTEEPHCSRCLQQLEPEAGLLPYLAAASPGTSLTLALPLPPAVRASALPPVVLQVMPLRGSPAPIGYIYNATLDADGGLLAAALAFFSHQGHQVFTNPCPNLDAYYRAMDVSTTIVSVNKLPNHILSSGLELMEGLFALSPTNSLGTAYMANYHDSPPSPGSASSRPVVPTSISTSIGFKNIGGHWFQRGNIQLSDELPRRSHGYYRSQHISPSRHLHLSWLVLLPPLRSRESVSLLPFFFISLYGIQDPSSLGSI
jgi:hypothetical protein